MEKTKNILAMAAMATSINSDPINHIAHSLQLPDLPLPLNCADYTRATSSHFICDHCFTRFHHKDILEHHLATCPSEKVTCDVCHLKFTNKGNLARHATSVHSLQKYNKQGKRFPCAVCEKTFFESWSLTQHVRRMHFNLRHEAYTHSTKSINEVWVEKVVNSDIKMQMTKVKKNIIVMKKCDASHDEEPVKIPVYRPDLQMTYVTADKRRAMRVKCEFCTKWMLKKSLRKHMNERHWNVRSHKCLKCDFTCKRQYQLLKHVCGEVKRRRRKQVLL